jgi:hypothetical protein
MYIKISFVDSLQELSCIIARGDEVKRNKHGKIANQLLPPFLFIIRELTWHGLLNHILTIYSFLLYYISYGYEFILIGKYIWLQIQPCQIYMSKTKKLMGNLLVKNDKVWISFYVHAL